MFDTLARRVEHAAGSPWTFFLAVVVVVVWAATGPIFEWSDTWQLVINTGTTIVTFLMVFLVQATQSRDTLALHTKLDELIRVGSGRNELINIENADVEVLSEVKRDIIVESSVDRDGL
jgi:low affinity Fe/Cu permease